MEISTPELDRKINIAVQILKLLEKEKVTFLEYKFIRDAVNGSVDCQKEDWYENECIKYTGNQK